MRRLFILLLAFVCGWIWIPVADLCAEEKQVAPEPYYGDIAKILAARLPKEHLTDQPLDDTISKRAWKNYLSALDPSHVYFLKSDIDSFKAHELTLDDELIKGDLSFPYDVFKVLQERVRNRCKYVNELLGKDFDLDQDEFYSSNRKDAPWAADNKEWDDLWRKLVKNDYVARVVADAMAEESKTNAAPKKGDPGKKGELSPKDAIAKRFRQFVLLVDGYDAEWVLQRYLVAVTHAYDPHCDYMSPSAVKDFDIEMKLSLAGIGAMLTWDEGVTKVTRLLPGGPADRDKRLKEGDKIVAVAQENEADVDIVGWPLEKVVRIIRGKKGTRLTLTVIPASDSAGTENARIELVRDEIKLEDHAAKGEVKEIKRKDRTVKCGVIALPAFYGDVDAGAGDRNARSSARDVERVLGELKDKHADGILLDLRNNGGGSLREAVYMTGLFIEDGPVVLVRQGRSVHVIPDPDPGIVYSGPLVIVVNRGTASSSEILAGALQDYGRAVVVGDSKTHGKGSVQVIVKLAADEKLGRLKVTNALFYRITGSSTQLKGVTSDLTVPSFSEGVEAGEDYLDNPLEWSSVSRVRYPAFGDLNPVVVTLDERARKRRAADEQFALYTNLVARIDANRKTEVLPLQLAKRKAMGAIWKELRDMQKKLGGDEGEKKGDIALDESLNILADLVEIWPFARRAEKPSRIGPAETEPSAAEISPDIEKQVEELVGKLGHDDPRVRKDARVKLKEIRKQARPALERYKEHKDPEIRATILELLKP